MTKRTVVRELDRIVERSLRQLAADTHVWNWSAKEHEWVSYYTFHYLVAQCSPAGPFKEIAQLGIEVAVPQPKPYAKQSVRRDLVIWRERGETCFGEDWTACRHPLAILEWKVHRPGHSNRRVNKEREWLRAYCQWQPGVVAYAIEIDGRRSPITIICTRFLGSSEDHAWLQLTLEK